MPCQCLEKELSGQRDKWGQWGSDRIMMMAGPYAIQWKACFEVVWHHHSKRRDHIFRNKFLCGNNFRCTETLQRQYREVPYTPHSVSLIVNISYYRGTSKLGNQLYSDFMSFSTNVFFSVLKFNSGYIIRFRKNSILNWDI